MFPEPLNTAYSLLKQLPFSVSVGKQHVTIPLLLFFCLFVSFPQSRIKVNQPEKKRFALYV